VVEAKAARPQSEGQDRITESLEARSEAVPGPRSVGPRRCRVLAENKSRAKRASDAEEMNRDILMSSFMDTSGLAVPLAGVAAGEEVASPSGGVAGGEGPDVVVPSHIGPVPLEDAAGVGVALDLEGGAEAGGPLEAELDAPHSREE